jgi:hypothetical protein
MIKFDTKKTPPRLVDQAWSRIPAERRADFWPCIICELPVDSKKSMWIHVVDGGGNAAEPNEAVAEAGDVGCHPIGPDCLRRQPQLKPVAFKLNRD